MIRHTIYGVENKNKPGTGKFVEVFMLENGCLGIMWTNNEERSTFYFAIKDRDDYEDFKNELTAVLRDCEDIGAAYYALEVYLDSPYADDFLEEWPEGDNIMNEFESRNITVEEYLKARDLMVGERNAYWTIYENDNFEDDGLAELLYAYDLVIDSLTCLAMEVDKK